MKWNVWREETKEEETNVYKNRIVREWCSASCVRAQLRHRLIIVRLGPRDFHSASGPLLLDDYIFVLILCCAHRNHLLNIHSSSLHRRKYIVVCTRAIYSRGCGRKCIVRQVCQNVDSNHCCILWCVQSVFLFPIFCFFSSFFCFFWIVVLLYRYLQYSCELIGCFSAVSVFGVCTIDRRVHFVPRSAFSHR